MIKMKKIFSILFVLMLAVLLVSCENDKDLRGAKEVTDKAEMASIIEEQRKNLESEDNAISVEEGEFIHSKISIFFDGDLEGQIGSGKVEAKVVMKYNPNNKLDDVYYKLDSQVELDMTPLSVKVVNNRHIVKDKYYIEETKSPLKDSKIKGNVNYVGDNYSLGLDLTANAEFHQAYEMINEIILNEANDFDLLEYIKIFKKDDKVIFKLETDVANLEEVITNEVNDFGAFNVNEGTVDLTLIFTPNGLEKASIDVKIAVEEDSDDMALTLSFEMFVANKDTFKKTNYNDYVESDDKTPEQAIGELDYGTII